MTQQQKFRHAKIVKDLFTQCENCKMWVRLHKTGEDGYRTIPVTLDPLRHKKLVCNTCWDKLDPWQHDPKANCPDLIRNQ